ncbi:hypothetical protein BH11MYX3_BH11MYX3_47650 [soil metagenome]
MLKFMIEANGTIGQATATSGLPTEINSCLIGVLAAWTFPESSNPVLVNYPLRFSMNR